MGGSCCALGARRRKRPGRKGGFWTWKGRSRDTAASSCAPRRLSAGCCSMSIGDLLGVGETVRVPRVIADAREAKGRRERVRGGVRDVARERPRVELQFWLQERSRGRARSRIGRSLGGQSPVLYERPGVPTSIRVYGVFICVLLDRDARRAEARRALRLTSRCCAEEKARKADAMRAAAAAPAMPTRPGPCKTRG